MFWKIWSICYTFNVFTETKYSTFWLQIVYKNVYKPFKKTSVRFPSCLTIESETLFKMYFFRIAKENNENGQNYFILLILTDGCIMDFPETSEAIVNVSKNYDK